MKVIYISKEHCMECDVALSRSEKMHSRGCCPYCGYVTIGTIVATTTKTYRKIKINPVWKFWKSQFKIEQVDTK